MTPLQHAVLKTIHDYTSRHLYAPTYREIKEMLGKSSEGNICRTTAILESSGYLKREAEYSRNLRLTEKGRLELGVNSCPGCGRVN